MGIIKKEKILSFRLDSTFYCGYLCHVTSTYKRFNRDFGSICDSLVTGLAKQDSSVRFHRKGFMFTRVLQGHEVYSSLVNGDHTVHHDPFYIGQLKAKHHANILYCEM